MKTNSNMVRSILLLLYLFLACYEAAPTTVLNTNSPEYQKALQDFLGGDSASLSAADLQKYKTMFNEYLEKNGFTLDNSVSAPNIPPPTPATIPPPTVNAAVPQVGLPAQPLSVPPQPFPVPGTAVGRKPPLSVFSSGLQGIGDTLYDTTAHQAHNVFQGVNEVIKGSDQVLTENAYQFQKFNLNNKDFLKQAAKTKGSALAVLPNTGTRLLKGAENFLDNPKQFANPLKMLLQGGSKKASAEQAAIDHLMTQLKSKNAPLHIKLTDPGNAETMNWLKAHPDVFVYLLQEMNYPILTEVLDNPSQLRNLLQEIEAAKYR